ncbi:hypothetical protein RUM43_002572 [Polyplax serrata]|uniref:Ubiquitin-like-conjugating enzyme ATG10 n=1 Tax=Polyplax serrata TaxID=468196 RepID=A0AAN8NZC6_POLSC
MLYTQFLKCVDHFIKISELTNDGWSVERYKDHVYLVKCMTQCLGKDVVESDDNTNDLVDVNAAFEKDDQSVETPPLKYRKWEYHVLHSLSYQVPVIYFNVWNSNGQLLSLDELWNAVNPGFKEIVLKNKWYTVTQNEHPYLFKPFFYFHPCHTEDFLNSFCDEKCNSLITWLSSIGQVIWLELNSTYGKLCYF